MSANHPPPTPTPETNNTYTTYPGIINQINVPKNRIPKYLNIPTTEGAREGDLIYVDKAYYPGLQDGINDIPSSPAINDVYVLIETSPVTQTTAAVYAWKTLKSVIGISDSNVIPVIGSVPTTSSGYELGSLVYVEKAAVPERPSDGVNPAIPAEEAIQDVYMLVYAGRIDPITGNSINEWKLLSDVISAESPDNSLRSLSYLYYQIYREQPTDPTAIAAYNSSLTTAYLALRPRT